mmetsp:Transcript_1857/g.2691  ORF Transcript_1857/g.2691 Transcript_1857/m.2691 type:complete len:116 (-) Transcript_1857:213-560(-)
MNRSEGKKKLGTAETKRKVSMSIPVPQTDADFHHSEDYDCQRYESLTWVMYNRIAASRALRGPLQSGAISQLPNFIYLGKNKCSNSNFEKSNGDSEEPSYRSDSSEYGDIFDMDI